MKYLFYQFFLASLFILISITSNAQYSTVTYASAGTPLNSIGLNYQQNYTTPNFSTEQFNQMIAKGSYQHPLVKTGKIMTFIGIPLAIIGGIMVANSDALYYNCVNGVCDGDPKGGFGVLILASGVGLSGTGIVLWTIGKNKSR